MNYPRIDSPKKFPNLGTPFLDLSEELVESGCLLAGVNKIMGVLSEVTMHPRGPKLCWGRMSPNGLTFQEMCT